MNRKLTILLTVALVSSIFPLTAATLIWSGEGRSVVSVTPETASGLAEVCVVYGTAGRTVGVAASSASEVKWYRYANLGGGYAEEITDAVYADGVSRLNSISGDMGYIVETPSGQYCFWVTDYAKYPFSVTAITENEEKDCNFALLDVAGRGEKINYYGINGRQFTLDRGITLVYRTLEADAENVSFSEKTKEVKLEYISHPVRVEAPLCQTSFTISGDRFLKVWGVEETFESSTFAPYAVKSLTQATQTTRDASNEVNPGSGNGSFGGSAPCEMSFEAAVTDGALFREWQISRSEDFEDVILSFQELSFDYTFTEEGNTYVRFVCANADGSCESQSEVYTISIGTSSLKCPNAFSPNGDGVNDEWKVSYSSIISFECHIFDRYGHKMATLTDPSQGWDGRHNGKTVPTGAYYYVITARGADGKHYKLSGDINIVSYSDRL